MTEQNNQSLSLEQLRDQARMERISSELKAGFDIAHKYRKSVSIFGSARSLPDSPYYQKAQSLAKRIVEETGYAIITGGGPGIMEAANRGAIEAQGDSVGYGIILPHEQKFNEFITDSLIFNYFFTRKVLLGFSAETFIAFPGGFGTFDELFEIITLIQTRKVPTTPIILFGKEFWTPLVDWIKDQVLNVNHAVAPEDLDLFVITEDETEIINIIKNAPVR